MHLLTPTLALSLMRIATATVPPEYLQENHATGDAPPSGAVDDVQTVVLSGGRDAVGESQPDNCPTIMIGTATPCGDHTNGWAEIRPTVAGFDLRRLVIDEVANATLPYYVENTKNLTQVKRVVITIAGLWRNGWKYANNMRNSLLCAAGREDIIADWNSILIAAPQWLNEEDLSVGAANDSDIHFHNNVYQRGAAAVGPGDVDLSSYEAMDQLVDMFWHKDLYPALEEVFIASHFPAQSNRCTDTYDEWPYGIASTSDSFPAYVADSASSNSTAISERYFNRRIFYGFGLEDNGAGDSHCEAQWQGSTHLERAEF
ncbi:hypothetical protein BDV06DRAFT_226156 [Aspergillus oleicola]